MSIAPRKFALLKSVLCKLEPLKLDPLKLTPLKLIPLKLDLLKSHFIHVLSSLNFSSWMGSNAIPVPETNKVIRAMKGIRVWVDFFMEEV